MSLDLLRRTRWIALSTLVMFGASSLGGCAPTGAVDDPTIEPEADGAGLEVGQNDETTFDEVTDVSHTAIRRQSIGNCWIYATLGWMESLRRRYTNGREEPNYSESYVTYWDWYNKITQGEVGSNNEVETGGWWGEAANITLARGIVTEAAFLPEEATMEMSQAQSRALAAINTSLRSGALSTLEARSNGRIVRDELDRAFGISASVIAEMDRVFGEDGVRTLATTRAARTIIKRPTEIAVGSGRTATGTRRTLHFADVMGTARSSWNVDQRSGAFAWQSYSYPYGTEARIALMRRVQRAMNDGHPVIVNWLVDFNALNSNGDFRLDEVQRRGIGRQGGHLSVVEDYVVDNVPGYGTLGLGALPADQRAAALQGTLRLIRIKNSWGTGRIDRASYAGYYDLYMDYLNGPIQWRGDATTGNGTPRTPLSSVVLPPGY